MDTSAPIAKRTHAAFLLRTHGNAEAAARALCDALLNKEDSCLLRHELAYILGQMRAASASPTLSSVLRDASDDAMVRHESAEALGAIGDASALPLLREHCDDPAPEVADTCRLAVGLLEWATGGAAGAAGGPPGRPFESVDPAPAEAAGKSVGELREQLTDGTRGLFDRYRALFALRDMATAEAVEALCEGLEDGNALLRHEVAYVCGQLQHAAAVPALVAALRRPGEHRMVRHEAAEALGAIGGAESEDALREYAADAETVVRESVEVALDTAEYWRAFEAPAAPGEPAAA